MFSINFTKRDFSGPVLPGPVRLSVERLEWRALGGPYSARLRAEAQTPSGLWSLANLLRCGVSISDGRGPAWWGWLSALELHDGARVARISLDEMGSKVSVGYQDYAGSRCVTPWHTDADSVRLYGEKERMFQLKTSDAAEAGAYAAAMLARVGKPVSSARLGSAPLGTDTGGCYAILEARGWWSTLDWTFYHEPRGRLGWTKGGSSQNWGHDATCQQSNWSITLPAGDAWTAAEVWVRMKRFRAADSVMCKLQSTAGGWPQANLSTCALPASAIPDEMSWVRFALNPAVTLQPGVLYFLGLERSGPANDPAAYYTLAVDEGLGSSGSTLYHWGSGGYIQRTPPADAVFEITGVEQTTEQLRRLLAASSFLSGVRLETNSAIQAPMWQDGSLRGQARAEQLLRLGVADGGRLLARIEPDRTARIYAAPAGVSPTQHGLVIAPDGQVKRADGRALAPSEWPAGEWSRLGELALFIEGCVWAGGRMRVAG